MKRVALALVALVGLALVAPITAAVATPRTGLSVVDTAATPKGWVSVDYGDAQISVPSNWNASYGVPCDFVRRPGSVFVGRTGHGACPLYVLKGVPAVYLVPEPGPGKPVIGTEQVVNGLVVMGIVHDSFENEYTVPALGVQLTLVGPKAQEVLSTLTWSPPRSCWPKVPRQKYLLRGRGSALRESNSPLRQRGPLQGPTGASAGNRSSPSRDLRSPSPTTSTSRPAQSPLTRPFNGRLTDCESMWDQMRKPPRRWPQNAWTFKA